MEKEYIKTELDYSEVGDQWLRDWAEPNVDVKEVIKVDTKDQWLRDWADPSVDVKDVTKEEKPDNEKEEFREVEGQCRERAQNDPTTQVTSNNNNNNSSKPNRREIGCAKFRKGLKIDLMIEKLCHGAPVSEKFSNKCLFQCPECNHHIQSWKVLQWHCAQKHANIKLAIFEVEKFIIKAVACICQICSAKCLSDNHFLNRHLVAKHKTTISQYKNKFETVFPKGLPEITYSDNIIGNLCLYECQKCKHNFKSNTFLQKHYRKFAQKEDMNKEASIIKHVQHRCHICQKSIRCELNYLGQHFKKQHQLSVEEYCSNTGCTLDKNHRKSNKDYSRKVSTINSEDLHPNSVRCTSIEYNKEKQLYVDWQIKKLCKDVPLSARTKNSCLFKCSKCDNIFKAWLTLRKHIAKAHSKAKAATNNISDMIIKVVSHKCKICQEMMLCDYFFISRHLQKHNIKPSQYNKVYALDLVEKGLEVSCSDNVIGDLCSYKCGDCKQPFDNRTCFYQHKAKSGHNSLCFTKKVCHQCKLCKKTLLCERITLKRHFKYSHGISTEEYCQKAGCTLAKRKIDIISRSFLESLELSGGLDKFCIFACDKCSKKYYTSIMFRKHYVRKHKSNTLNPIETYIVKGFSYQCPKCSKLLLCENIVIQSHMKRVHGMCKSKKGAVTFTKDTEYYKVCDTFIKNTPITHTYWGKTVLPRDQIPINEITPKIGNLCSFKCPDCDSREFSNWSMLYHHNRRVHGHNIHYQHTLLSVARCHACLLCPMVVLCDRSFITMHLNSHKMKLKKYEKIYQQNGGDILPTFKEWMTSNKDMLAQT